jgi:DNA polymerase-3 subunit delta'
VAARRKPGGDAGRGGGGGGAAPKAVRRAAAPASPAPTAPVPRPTPKLAPPLGQGRLFLALVAAARRLELHHAVVVSGAPGAGKSTAARWLAAALLCPSDHDAMAPCGACRTCRRVATGNHPDLHLLALLEDKREIAVDQVRDLQAALLRAPVEGRARAVLIDPAAALNEEGQNALLKTLEEPGPATFLLLCTSRPEQLLPTVRSRCQRLVLRGLDPALLQRELSARTNAPAPVQQRALELADGSLGRALAACTERTVQLHDLVLEMLTGAKRLRPMATARSVLEGSDGRAGAVLCAREFLQLLAGEARARLQRSLADAAGGSYREPPSEPWVSVLESALVGAQDLDLQIPPDQAVAGALLAIARQLRREH